MKNKSKIVKCENCGNFFKRRNSDLKKTKNHFCSLKCWYDKADIAVVNREFFNIIDTEGKAYWMGFIYADGTLGKDSNKITINLAKRDKKHLQKFAKIFKAKVKDSVHGGFIRPNEPKKTFYQSSCTIFGKTLWNGLNSKGVVPRKTYVDSDEPFNHVPDNLMHHFVRGFFDGDGTIYSTTNTIGFKFVGTELFLTRLRNEIVKILKINNVSVSKSRTIFALGWTGYDQLSLIKEWLYKDATVYLERKKERFDNIKSRNLIKKTSKYRGVCWNKKNKRWQSMIRVNNVVNYLGYFIDEEDAAKEYDKAILKYNLPKFRMNNQDWVSLENKTEG